jgi:hypothetical protein
MVIRLTPSPALSSRSEGMRLCAVSAPLAIASSRIARICSKMGVGLARSTDVSETAISSSRLLR